MNPDSCECTKVEVKLFTILPTNISMEREGTIEYLPIVSVRDGSPIEFHICK